MAKSYHEFVEWLFGLQKFGIKLGLEKINYLVKEIGNPHEQYPVIHIAGTNGKGSVAAMISAVLQSHGLKTGLYTSPHLVRFTERIKIDGAEISEEAVVEYSQVLKPHVDTLRATFFEATTAMAFKYFADNKVDVAVIETGLGGRFDATNVVSPVLSIITSIGLEHQKYLGRTLARIAYEKGGIIKEGVPVVTGVQSARALEVLKEIAHFTSAPMIEVTPFVTAVLREQSLYRSLIDVYYRDALHYENLVLGLPGTYQIRNALVAIRAIDVLRGKIGTIKSLWNISDENLRRGLEQTVRLTGLKGRMQFLENRNGKWILDVAHNPGAMRELARAIDDVGMKNIPVVFGVLNDKDVKSMVRSLARIARVLYLVAPNNERALSVENLRETSEELFFPVVVCGTVETGLQTARSKSKEGDITLVTGSHFVVGEALEFLEQFP